MSCAKPADEIVKELPEEFVDKIAQIERTPDSRPTHSDIVYFEIEHGGERKNITQFKSGVETHLEITTSWDVIKDRCNDLHECGLFAKADFGNSVHFYFSDCAKEILETDTEANEQASASIQNTADTTSSWVTDSIAERPTEESMSSSPSYLEELLHSPDGDLTFVSLGMIAIGGIFFVAGLGLLGIGLSTVSGEIVASIGLLGILGGVGLFLYLSSQYYLN